MRSVRLTPLPRTCVLLACAAAAAATCGCSSSPRSAVAEQFHETPGRYPAGPLNAVKPRVGVPTPMIEPVAGASNASHVEDAAADQLFWVADRSSRFNLIERVRLGEMIDRDGLQGMIRAGELVRPSKLHGVDYLLVCRISGLSIQGGEKPSTVSVANVERLLHVDAPKPKITTRAIVDLRLVNPITGAAPASVEDHFVRVCSPESMGLNFESPDAAWGELHLNDEQATQVLRIVLDDSMRKFLPRVDALLIQPAAPAIAGVHTPTTGPTSRPSQGTSVAKIRCPECGFDCSTDDEFCPNCGARLLRNGVRLKPAGK